MTRSRHVWVLTFLLFSAGLQARALPGSAPAPAATTWVEVNKVNLRYQLFGRGPTVVLLHEMSMSLESWDDVLPAIVPGHQVLRYDLRGFGLSEKIRGTLTIDDEVEDLRALLAALQINGKVTLIGGAVGAAVALKFAALYPERVRGVLATSPAAYLATQPERAAAFSGDHTLRETDNALDAVYPPALRAGHPERLARFRAIQYATDPGSHAATVRMIYSTAFADVLPKIQCPVEIVATALFARPVASFKELADAIPHGRLTVLQTGHFASMESPEMVVPLIRDFLKETDTR
jgi:3-oxoadipate enol-lactonase